MIGGMGKICDCRHGPFAGFFFFFLMSVLLRCKSDLLCVILGTAQDGVILVC